MTNELIINGIAYEFKFGMAFLREIDKRHTREANGVVQNVGLAYKVAELTDYNLEALFDVLFIANKGFMPRLDQKAFDTWIEDEGTDVEEVFKTVLGFLEASNCTAIMTKRILTAMESL